MVYWAHAHDFSDICTNYSSSLLHLHSPWDPRGNRHQQWNAVLFAWLWNFQQRKEPTAGFSHRAAVWWSAQFKLPRIWFVLQLYPMLLSWLTVLHHWKMAIVRHSCCTAGNFGLIFQLQLNNFTQKYPIHLSLRSTKSYINNDRNQALILVIAPRSYQHCPLAALSSYLIAEKQGMLLVNWHAAPSGEFSETDIASNSYQVLHILSQKLTTLILCSPPPHQC